MYQPEKNLLLGIESAFPIQMFPWDDYFPRMAQTDFLSGRANVMAVKSFFMRKAPFGGSYALLGGITAALSGIDNLNFQDPYFQAGMRDMGYKPEFLKYLFDQERLRLQVFAPPEGALMFPNEPIITVVGTLPAIRLAEGVITEAVNFASLSLTKWHRLVRTVRPGGVMEFARRRAQNARKATLYAMLAGGSSSSNSDLRQFFDIPISGTMGHEWIQGFGDIRLAFDTWLEYNPDRPIGLVDTKQCLEYDFPIWLDEVWHHREKIQEANPPIWGWRNDSGDLAYLAIEQYRYFLKNSLGQDPWFNGRMRIFLTNDLDEYSSAEIIQQIRAQAGAAGLDAEDILRRIVWAAGTKPGTCDDQPSFGGVAKLMEVNNLACIKLAFDAEGRPGVKTSIPGFNQSCLVRGPDGEIKTVLIYPARRYAIIGSSLIDKADRKPVEELVACHPDVASSRLVFSPGKFTVTSQQSLVYDSLHSGGFTEDWDNPTLDSVRERVWKNVDSLHWSMTRLEKPYPMKVSLTPDLFDLRQRMIMQGVLREDFLK